MASQIYSRYVPPSKKKAAPILPAVDISTTIAIPEPSIPTPPVTRQDASSTYARYIPPKKKGPVVPHDIPPIAAQSPPPIGKRKLAEVTDHNDDASSPKFKKKKKKQKQEDEATPKQIAVLIPASEYYEPEPEQVDEETISTVRTRSKRKEQKEKEEQTGTETILPEENTIPDADESLSITPKKKSRKEKRSEAKLEAKLETIPAPLQEEKGVEQDDIDEDSARHRNLLKKREKSMRKTEKLSKKEAHGQPDPFPDVPAIIEEEEVHDLVPLPQPEPVPEPPPPSIIASLPPWLAEPLRVSATASSSFKDIGLSKDVAAALGEKGFKEALPIQGSVLPLLLPGKSQKSGDLLVSAATGSGKTLAYVLPMIEYISRNRHMGIQGLIVVPTRELVSQARQVCEACVSVFSKADGYPHRPVVGTAVGNETLQAEQEILMGEELVFDPTGYDNEIKAANSPWEALDESITDRQLIPQHEFKSRIPSHVIKPCVKIDILICTPGRLVEHLNSTPGFSLQNIRWLAVDEADKLLDQSFQQWLDILMGQIQSSKRSIRDRVRKVILSATMTTDIGQLTSLKLHRPKLVVLEGSSSDGTDSAHELALPALLKESGVKVEDDAIKPLYLLELLRRAGLISDVPANDDSDSDSSDSDSDSDSESDTTTDRDPCPDSASSFANGHLKAETFDPPLANISTVLIFTKSNETAVRLGRLMALLCPTISAKIGILTSTTPRQARQRTISSFSSGKTTILVASDLVSRGLDLPNLAHVINYDVPPSLTSYVHRIGRTARAGKAGHAWTLFTSSEGGWFWREIARNTKVHRVEGAKVERVNIKKELFDNERERYEEALEALEKEASNKAGK